MTFDSKTYHRLDMRRERAWDRGADAVMRLPPEKRIDAASELFERVYHDQIMRDTRRHTNLVALLGRINEASQ